LKSLKPPLRENKLAALFIPGPTDTDALKWRLWLIKKWRPADCEQLINLLKAGKKDWQPKHARMAESLADSIVIDEVDRVEMLAGHMIKDAENLPTKSVQYMHRNSGLFVNPKDPNPELTVKNFRANLVDLRDSIFTEYLPRIRAKFAVLEVLAILPMRPTIIRLIQEDLTYLGSGFVINWIKANQYLVQHGSKSEQIRAKSALDRLASVITVDQRRRIKGTVNQWFVYFRFLRMCEELDASRRGYRQTLTIAHRRAKLPAYDRKYFDKFCEVFRIGKMHQNRVLSRPPSHGIKEIVIDCLIEDGLVASPKAFRVLYTKLGKLAKNHDWIGISVIESLLDARRVAPKIKMVPTGEVFKFIN